MKKLAEREPAASSSLITLPNKTLEGRDRQRHRDHRGRQRRRRQARLPADGRPPRPRVAVGRARDGVGLRARQRLRQATSASPASSTQGRTIVVPIVNVDGFNVPRGARRPRQRPADEQLPDSELSETGQDRAAPVPRRPVLRLQAPQLPRPAGPDDAAAAPARCRQFRTSGVDPNRNYGGLWGGPGASAIPRVRHLPRRGPVLRARDAEHPVARLRAPGHDAHHEPHVSEPHPAPAGRRAPRARRSTRRGLQGARRRDGARERLHQPDALRALRHDRRRPRTGPTTRPAASATRSRSRPRTTTGRLRRPGFHPAYADDGQGVGRHERPGRPHGGRATGGVLPDGEGATARRTTSPPRALDEARQRHQGAPAGATLRLTKAFKTETSPAAGETDASTARRSRRDKMRFDDKLETKLRRSAETARSAGVNPSTRPVVAPNRVPRRCRRADAPAGVHQGRARPRRTCSAQLLRGQLRGRAVHTSRVADAAVDTPW